MEIQDFSKHLEGLEAAVKRQLERDLPKKLGNIAVRLFKENFQREGFFGQRWQEVKRRRDGSKGAAGSRRILTGPTGDLGRSIQMTPGDAVRMDRWAVFYGLTNSGLVILFKKKTHVL